MHRADLLSFLLDSISRVPEKQWLSFQRVPRQDVENYPNQPIGASLRSSSKSGNSPVSSTYFLQSSNPLSRDRDATAAATSVALSKSDCITSSSEISPSIDWMADSRSADQSSAALSKASFSGPSSSSLENKTGPAFPSCLKGEISCLSCGSVGQILIFLNFNGIFFEQGVHINSRSRWRWACGRFWRRSRLWRGLWGRAGL